MFVRLSSCELHNFIYDINSLFSRRVSLLLLSVLGSPTLRIVIIIIAVVIILFGIALFTKKMKSASQMSTQRQNWKLSNVKSHGKQLRFKKSLKCRDCRTSNVRTSYHSVRKQKETASKISYVRRWGNVATDGVNRYRAAAAATTTAAVEVSLCEYSEHDRVSYSSLINRASTGMTSFRAWSRGRRTTSAWSWTQLTGWVEQSGVAQTAGRAARRRRRRH